MLALYLYALYLHALCLYACTVLICHVLICPVLACPVLVCLHCTYMPCTCMLALYLCARTCMLALYLYALYLNALCLYACTVLICPVLICPVLICSPFLLQSLYLHQSTPLIPKVSPNIWILEPTSPSLYARITITPDFRPRINAPTGGCPQLKDKWVPTLKTHHLLIFCSNIPFQPRESPTSKHITWSPTLHTCSPVVVIAQAPLTKGCLPWTCACMRLTQRAILASGSILTLSSTVCTT